MARSTRKHVWAIAIAVQWGSMACDDGKDPAPPTKPAPTAAAPSCPTSRKTESGLCCAAGQAWSAAAKACVAVGPPECAKGAAELCVPRWCADWRTAKGEPCDAQDALCQSFGRACTDAERAAGLGCPAGAWPASATAGDCHAADSVVRPVDAAAAATADSLDSSIAAGIPMLEPLAGLDDTWFCRETMAEAPRFCTPAELATCHSLPSVPNSYCLRVGVPWPNGACPPGFVATSKAELAPCAPDPKECGGEPWTDSGLPGNPIRLYVSATLGNDAAVGSKAAPVKSIGRAVELAQGGEWIFIAAGDYAENPVISKSVTLVGRCAAQVKVVSKGGPPAVTVGHTKTVIKVAVRGMTITGDGEGVWHGMYASLVLQRMWITGVRKWGVTSVHTNHLLSVAQSVIADVRPALPDLGFGYGIYAAGATAQLEDVRVSGTRSSGIMTVLPATVVSGTGVLIDGTLINAGKGTAGTGVQTNQGASVVLTRSRISANIGAGAAALGSGSHLKLTQVLVDHTQTRPIDGQAGLGMTVVNGGSADLRAVRISANHDSGIIIGDKLSKVFARGLLVDGTLPTLISAEAGMGLTIVGGSADVRGLRSTGNAVQGVLVFGPTGTLTLRNALIDNTKAGKHGKDEFGFGIATLSGAKTALFEVRLSHNTHAGLLVEGSGSTLKASRLLIDSTRPPTVEPTAGFGIVVSQGAVATINSGRLHANYGAGALVGGSKSALRLVGVLIDGSQATLGQIDGGRGVVAQDNAELWLQGCKLLDNASGGVVAIAAQSSHLVGVVVAATRVNAAGKMGNGAQFDVVAEPSTVVSCHFDRNASSAVAYHGCPGLVDNSVLSNSQLATYPTFFESGGATGDHLSLADGLVAVAAPAMVVTRSLVLANPRAGLLLKDCKSASVSGTLASGGIFGLVTLGPVVPLVENCAFFGSDTAISSNASLLIPPPPELAATP